MKTRIPQDVLIHAGLITFAAFCLLLPATLIWSHLSIPSDGARLSRTESVFTSNGAVVTPYQPGIGVLKDGDVVTAVDHIDLLTWAQGLFNSRLERPTWQPGETSQYSVLRNGQLIELEIPLGKLPLSAILSDHWSVILFFLAAQAIAIFVYWQRPSDPAARALWIWAFSGSHTYSWAFFLQVSDILKPTGFWLFHLAATGLWLIFWAAVLHMVLVFPKPLFHIRPSPRWVILLYLSPFILFTSYLVWEWQATANLLTWLDSWGMGQLLVAILYTVPSLVILVIQYATSKTEVERIKNRWITYGTLISLGLGLSLYFLPSLFGKSFLSPNALGVINFPFIITMAIAIWRYHLFDIDIIIRKTLVYSLLTGLLSLIYFSGVALMQAILTADLGPLTASNAVGSTPPAVVVVITTLAVAGLFNPLRRRIQDFIDRRFYRRKYDAEQALAEFAAAARSEAEVGTLANSMLQLVGETLQPSKVSLWLQPAKHVRLDSQEETR